MPTYVQRKEHLELWVAALGADAKRTSLTPEPIRLVLQDWRAGGMSAATCNKRRTALMHLFSVLDGKDARNPVRAVPKFPVDDPLPRGRDYAVIRTRLDAMVDSKTKARLLVMLWTGMRPIEVMRAKPEDLHWKDRYVIVRTAKRGRTRTVGLTAKAVKAWRLFDALDAWGTFTLPPMNRMVKKACKMADVSVYDMRHSYGTALARSRVRLDVIGALMGHSSLELTKRYTLAAVSPEAAEATRRLARAGNRNKKLAVAAGSRSRSINR
jgi:integrase